jgi:hypothetical protein
VVNSPIASTTGTVQIATGIVAGPTAENVWEFGADGNLTVPDDIQDANGSVIRVATTSTAPTRVDGQLWFDNQEGRLYIKNGGVWLDASPTQIPSPETYLDEITIDGSTLNINGGTLTISNTGTLLVNGSEVTGSGDSINNGPYSVSIDNIGAVTMETGRGTVLFGNIPEGPTGSTHFHIMKDSPSTVDLFFGDDYNYVKLPTTQGVEIGAEGNVWQFSTTGTLTLPNGGNISSGMGAFRLEPAGASSATQALLIYPTVADGNHIHLTAGFDGETDLYLGNDDQFVKIDHSGTVVVQTYSTVTDTDNTWTFGTDGVLTLSTASTILGSGADPNVYIETATTSTTSTWTFGTNGVLTLPAATPIIKGGGTGTDVTVIATTGTNTATWVFAADGSTSLASGVEISNSSGLNFVTWNTGSALILTDTVNLNPPSFIYIPSSSDTVSRVSIANTNTTGGVILVQGLGDSQSSLEVNSGGVSISTIVNNFQTGAWQFSSTGTLKFPDNTQQTTAYTGTVAYSNITGAPAVVNKTTGSWTLSPGANTVSITVAPGNNYQMWVNGNIPNGIVEWNATVNVSNTNVPAIGSQYGWYYVDGNALVLTSMPNQIVGTAGVISTATVATTSSNVFRFGITNNSTSSRVVNWGYTTL